MWAKLKNEKVVLSTAMCNLASEEHNDNLVDWVNAEDASYLVLEFSIAGIVVGVVSMHEMPAYGGALVEKIKPLVDAIRAEFVAQIARIDALKYGIPK